MDLRYPAAMHELSRRELVKLLVCSTVLAACGESDPSARSLPKVKRHPQGLSRFRHIYADPKLRADFLLFLTHVFHLVPEHDLHRVITEACGQLSSDRDIYARVSERMPEIAPMLSSVRFALPALAQQKAEMATETAQLIRDRVRAERYVEIGTPGRYVKALRDQLYVGDEVYLVHTSEPSMSPEDIVERGSLLDVGTYIPLDDYAPLTDSIIPRGKIDLVSNYIGLHHAPRSRLEAFVDSIRESLRPGGIFVLRDHDVIDHDRDVFVALAHDVFNAGLGLPWSYNAEERRHFQSIDAIETYVVAHGFKRFGPRLAQTGDPTHNLLLAFERT